MINIKKKIKKILMNVLNTKKKIRSTDSLKKLKIDSLDIIEIIMELENIFNIKIKDETIEKLTTVEKLINYIQKNIKKK